MARKARSICSGATARSFARAGPSSWIVASTRNAFMHRPSSKHLIVQKAGPWRGGFARFPLVGIQRDTPGGAAVPPSVLTTRFATARAVASGLDPVGQIQTHRDAGVGR